MSIANSGQVVLGDVKKQAEQDSRQHPSMAGVNSACLLEFLSYRPSPMNSHTEMYSQIKAFPPKLISAVAFHHNSSNPNQDTSEMNYYI